MLFPSRETCLYPSWPSSCYISPATEFSGKLPQACLPASPVASGSVGEISGGVAFVRTDFLEDMLSLLSLFLELARARPLAWIAVIPTG